jgi:tRNA A-37 threonylcarbamoyl transferase component Bud32
MVRCPHCATENRADATFCNTCGYLLKAGAAPAGSTAASPSTSTAPALHATGRLAPQSKLRGRYLILKNIGQGGMAAVYLAHDLREGRSVALKEMSQDGLPPDELREALESFESEARLLTHLRHPNLPRVYETFSEQGRHYLAMDYIAGETLEQRQQRAGGAALPEAEVLGWARQICDVLTYLHGQRPPVIFRDLKPANIMLTADGQIKLIDFGIARVFAPGRTRDTQVLGTPGFAPPEQYGKAQTDARADVYAMGCTLYQLLTGYDPGTTPFNLPPMASRSVRVAPAVQRAIERATKLDRENRYPTIEAFRHDLLPAATTAAPAPQPRTAPQPAAATKAKPSITSYQAAKAAPGTMAARVVVQPYVVDLGTLVSGQRGTVAITVGGLGGAPVHGQVSSPVPWLRVDKDRFDGASTVVQVIAETSALGGAKGMQTTSLQVTCDSHLLFVPVRFEVVAASRQSKVAAKTPVAPAPAKAAPTGTAAPTPAKPAPRVAPKTRPVDPKHAQPPVQRTRTLRLVSGLVGGMTLSVLATTAPARLISGSASPQLPMLTAPLALGLLLLASLAAGVGALAGTGGANWRGRIATTLFAALIGGFAVIAFGGPWYWTGVAGILTRHVATPIGVQLGVQAAASVGGTLGADAGGSLALHRIGGFLRRYSGIFVPVGMCVAGGVAGLLLTRGYFLGCLTPLGIVGGAWAGWTLARALGFSPRLPRRYQPPQRRWRLYP